MCFLILFWSTACTQDQVKEIWLAVLTVSILTGVDPKLLFPVILVSGGAPESHALETSPHLGGLNMRVFEQYSCVFTF